MRTINRFLFFVLFTVLFIACGSKEAAPDGDYSSLDSSSVDACEVDTSGLVSSAVARTNEPKDRKFKKTATVRFQVKNVLQATEGIEDIVFAQNGYIVNSNISNDGWKEEAVNISLDSVLIIKKVRVRCEMTLKVPSSKLDSVLRKLRPYIVFLEERNIVLDDVTYEAERNQSQSERLDNYTERQQTKIDKAGNKLNDITNAEEAVLDRQLQADEARMQNKQLNYDIAYSTLIISIYQNEIVIKDKIEDSEYLVKSAQPNLLVRIGHAIVNGWEILETILVFIFNIWGVLAIIFAVIFGLKYLIKVLDKKKNK